MHPKDAASALPENEKVTTGLGGIDDPKTEASSRHAFLTLSFVSVRLKLPVDHSAALNESEK